MLSHLITRLVFLFLINCCAAGDNPCKWKSGTDFCWLLCSNDDFSNFTNYVEEKWTERPQCHANGISLGLFSGTFPSSTVPANWFLANVKVNYLEFGMSRVNDIEDNAFSADAFRTIEHLTITEMDSYDLKKGMFNGLDALQTLTFADATHLRSVEMGILDALNQTLKELRIESDMRGKWDLPIAPFTGSKQTLNVELVKIHYTMKRLTNKSFISLTKVKYFDLSDCNIEYIEEGTFDPIMDTVSIIQLANNDVKILPAGMFDSKPMNYQYTVVMVGDRTDCLCGNVPINFFMRVKCNEKNFSEMCSSYLPREPGASYSIETSTSLSTQPLTEPPSLPIHIFRVAEGMTSGDLVIYVNATTIKDHVTLILDVTNEDLRGSHCIRSMVNCYTDQSNRSCSLTVENLQSNTKYTLCVAEDEGVMKTPACINDRSLCVEYKTRKSYSQIWATPFLVIVVLVSIVSVSLMVGLLTLLCKD